MMKSEDNSPQIQNLTRLIWERLENISCYDIIDFITVCTLTLHTNLQVLKVWESQETLLKFNRLGHSSWGKRLNLQESDGLIKREFTKVQIYNKSLRQNYHLIIPPRKYDSCEDWQQHFYVGSHQERTSTKKPRGKKKNYPIGGELPDNFNEQLQEYQDFQDRLLTGNLNPLDEINFYDQI